MSKYSENQKCKDFTKIQRFVDKSNEYKSFILELRKKKVLHSLVEWRIAKLLEKTRYEEDLFPKAESCGVSNGRIDLAAFNGRSVTHIEFIAGSSSGHVFRDTTSLLYSSADSKIAVLIDKDVDPTVSKSYFSAIPIAKFDHVYLRKVVLQIHEQEMISTLEHLVSSAEFRCGKVSRKEFWCELENNNLSLEFYKSYRLFYHNAPENQRMRVVLRNIDSSVDVGFVHQTSKEGDTCIYIPANVFLQGECRLEVTFEISRARWVQVLYLQDKSPEPSLVIATDKLEINSPSHFALRDFPKNCDFFLTFHQGHTGTGIFTGKTDSLGMASGEITIKNIINNKLIVPGKYRIQANSETPINIPALAVIEVISSLNQADITLREGITTGSKGELFNLSLGTVTLSVAKITTQLKIENCRDRNFNVRVLELTLNHKETGYSFVASCSLDPSEYISLSPLSVVESDKELTNFLITGNPTYPDKGEFLCTLHVGVLNFGTSIPLEILKICFKLDVEFVKGRILH